MTVVAPDSPVDTSGGRTYTGLLTVHFELGGFAVAVITCFGVPLFYLECDVVSETDTAKNILRDAALSVYKNVSPDDMMGVHKTLSVEFRGRVRLMTNKEWRESNTALSAPTSWGVVEIDEIIAVREPHRSHTLPANAISIALWLIGTHLFSAMLSWFADRIMGFIYG
ncbi:MAG: hypothetical protein H7Y38_16050 [Armatimonadetes bacterium]|nr:hypothetical protein [Armatimonadota bacterium]